MRPSLFASLTLRAVVFPLLLAPALARAQSRPASDSGARVVMPRPPADTDTVHRASVIPGLDFPFQADLRLEANWQRIRNLRCSSAELYQASTNSACNGRFLATPTLPAPALSFQTSGVIGNRLHLNVDYDSRREFSSSQTISAYYEGPAGSKLQRVDFGNIDFAAPASRFIAPSLPTGNYGLQVTNQFGALKVRSIFAQQSGSVVQNKLFYVGGRTQQHNEQELEDFQIERLRFFFTIDPALFGRAYPNIDILDPSQMRRLWSSLPDTLRPSQVFLYRLQFGAQPQNPNGPRFRVRGIDSQGTQTYDVLREGVDYYLDPSHLWFALVRPLVENERLVVAYKVRVNGRDTVFASTGGTPDIQYLAGKTQIANLVMDPSVGPSSPAFRNEIRSVYLLAGESLDRKSMQVRIVAGSGMLERPVSASYATFLQMFGLSQATSPASFDFENRLWPQRGDPAFNLGAGAPDVRNGQSFDAARIIREHFLVFPSLHPFAARDSGLVAAGNATNEALYTIPGEYLVSSQHPASVYRIHFTFETVASDSVGSLALGASQMRPGSERVLVDGRPLARELDYRINYDLGTIEFTRPDTLFRLKRRVEASFEENPTFGATPVSIAGVVSELPVSHGLLTFSALNQHQSTANDFTRPQLGFQGASTLTAGATASFNWNAPLLTQLVSRLPFGESKTPSRISLVGEVASSHPQFGATNNNKAYLENFDAGGGIEIALGDQAWSYSSMPAYGNTLRSFGGTAFEPSRASTMVWQSNVRMSNGASLHFTQGSIDPLLRFVGTGVENIAPVLWVTLLPLDQTGDFQPATRKYNWTSGLPNTSGRRWRSMKTVLSASGMDLTANEHLEFWALVDTSHPTKNPALIFDFGDVSENTLSFAPESLTIQRNAKGTVDSLFRGRRIQGFDSLNTERDRLSRAFNAEVNDTGLPGDLIDTLVVNDGSTVKRVFNVPICRATPNVTHALGDQSTNCTIGNNRLDEEDIDLDYALNFPGSSRENERVLRYVVDLSDPAKYKRVGGSFTDSLLVNGAPIARTRQWVLVSVPFKTPTDSLNDVNRRRIRALRLTVVSGAGQDPEEPTQFPIAELRVTGAPWLNRNTQTLAGLGAVRPEGGFVVLSTIGTNDSSTALIYQSPPGVNDEAQSQLQQFASTRTVTNESSMRIQAGGLPLYHRAEAYLRFASGPQFLLGYKELRVWGRGRGNGWGPTGDLQMYMKVGRDENNFYLRRVPANAGLNAAAWTDVVLDFDKFVTLRDRIQQDYLAGKTASIACTGLDSALVASTPLPTGAHHFAACDDGYIAYTVDPAVTAPNLAAVQELAVGIVRVNVGGGGSPIFPSDTLELWVDDIRLNRQVNSTGYAGQLGVAFNAGDFGDFRINVSNKDPNFRQLAEQPTFLGQRNVDMAMTLQLQKLLPRGLGVALPLTVTRVSTANDPLYLSQSDISGHAIPGVRKPKNDVTTYSLTIRTNSPRGTVPLAPLLDNLALNTSYVTGVDRTEFQDGNARNLTASLDYLVTPDSGRTAQVPFLPIAGGLRVNPVQFRMTSGIVRGDDKRVSFLSPSSTADEAPATSTAATRLWRNGSVLEFRPTPATSARWEFESLRDFRDYRDSSYAFGGTSQHIQANPGFERERTITTAFAIAPAVSAWFHPRADFGTQYSMLRDPNVRSFTPLPGVIGVDSVLATRDSLEFARLLALPRRMTAAQTGSIGTMVDVSAAFAAYSTDSTARRIGRLIAPIDVSYTRSLLSSLDASSQAAPLPLQFGLGNATSFRTVNGENATSAGETGTLNASSSVRLPLGTSVAGRFRRTTTLNWIGRPDSTLAHVDGGQTQFPDVALRWGYRPAGGASLASVNASAGYVRNTASVSLPNLYEDVAPEIRHTFGEQFPFAGSFTLPGRSAINAQTTYTFRRQTDSLPGSIARTRGNDLSVNAGGAFHVPASLGLGLKNDVRTRFGVQQTKNTTYVFDVSGASSRLQDNGRTSWNLTADSDLADQGTLTLQASYVIYYDYNLNHRFAQTQFSIVYQLRLAGK